MDQIQDTSTAPVAPPTTAAPWKLFLQRMFSDSGEPSSSRTLTSALALVCSIILLGVFRHVCQVKDPSVLGLWLTSLPSVIFALIGLINAPYLINRGSGTMSDLLTAFKKGNQQ